MKRYCAAALLLTVFGLPAFAARAGSDAMPFLKLDSGARAAALAGAYCASGDDALSVFYNPAGAAVAARKEFVFSHTEWLQGIRHESLGYVHPLSSNSTVFGSANMLVSGEMVKFNAAGSSVGSFSANDYAFGGGFASALGRRFYGAIGMKLFYQKADGNGATGWGGDAGLLKLYEDFRFGFSASNIGGRLKMGATTFNVPLMLRTGGALLINEQYWVMADVTKPGAGDATVGAGSEAEFEINRTDAFFVRAGYRTGRSTNAGSGLTLGAGLRNRDLRFDYAFAPYGDLGDSHRFTLRYAFGAKRTAFERTGKIRDYGTLDKDIPLSKRKKQVEMEKKKTLGEFNW